MKNQNDFSSYTKAKAAFINRLENHDSLKNAKTLYLWTEKGAFLHAKSLNTDKAWEFVDTITRVMVDEVAIRDFIQRRRYNKTFYPCE